MSRVEITTALQAIIRETFAAPNAVVSDDTVASDVPGWDSLSHTVLLFEIEERFGVELPADVEFDNLGQLITAIGSTTAAGAA